jgi:hypothetical protein
LFARADSPLPILAGEGLYAGARARRHCWRYCSSTCARHGRSVVYLYLLPVGGWPLELRQQQLIRLRPEACQQPQGRKPYSRRQPASFAVNWGKASGVLPQPANLCSIFTLLITWSGFPLSNQHCLPGQQCTGDWR